MPNNKELLTPISRANTKRLRTNVELPFNLSDKVAINTRFAEALLQIGGFRQAKIQGDIDGEISEAIPQIVGIDSRGSALAGKAQIKTVPAQSYKVRASPDRKLSKQAKWNDLNVNLNLAEMQNQIKQEDGSVRDPQVWANKINTALKKGFIGAGVNNLLGGLAGYEKYGSMGLYGMSIILGYLTTDGGPPTVGGKILLSSLIIGITDTLIDSFLLYGPERAGSGRRLSLILGPEIDRAILLGIMGNLYKLAKTVEN